MLNITQAVTEEHLHQVRQLRAEMGRWDAKQAAQLGLDPAQILAHFYSTDDSSMLYANSPPDGGSLLAIYADNAAGCAALRRIDVNSCELHHLYVRDQFRRMRIGRGMVERLVLAAKTVGYRRMLLETTTFMMEARALYASIGFRCREPYYKVPRAFEAVTLFMELKLVPTEAQ